jgi:hypothetical protein
MAKNAAAKLLSEAGLNFIIFTFNVLRYTSARQKNKELASNG